MGTNETTVHLSGHQGAIYDACWDEASQTWLTAGGDGIIAQWPSDGQGEGRALLHHHKAFFSVSSFESQRAAGTENGELFRWTGTNASSATRIEAHRNGIFALAWMPDGRLLTGGGDERILLWEGSQLSGEWRIPGAQKIRSIVPHNDKVFIGTTRGQALLYTWNAGGDSLEHEAEMTGHNGGCYAAVWHPHKQAWITGGRDGHLRIWRENQGELLAFPAHEGAIYRMAIAGDCLWTVSRDKSLKAWRLDDLSSSGKITHRNGGSARSINALAHSEKAVMFGGDDRIGRILPH